MTPLNIDRVELSRRLKAARWLAGGTDARGNPVDMTREELAQLPALVRNGITANELSEIERVNVKKDIFDYHLTSIIDALDLPEAYFGEVSPRQSEILKRLERIEALLAEARAADQQQQSAEERWDEATRAPREPDDSSQPPAPEDDASDEHPPQEDQDD